MHKCQKETLGCGHTIPQQALKLTLLTIPLNSFTHSPTTYEIFPLNFSHLYFLSAPSYYTQCIAPISAPLVSDLRQTQYLCNFGCFFMLNWLYLTLCFYD